MVINRDIQFSLLKNFSVIWFGFGHKLEERISQSCMKQKMAKTLDFFKVYVPEDSSEEMLVPPPYVASIGRRIPDEVVLRTRQGREWKIRMAQTEEGLFFRNGWKKFVRDNSLVMAEFLVFKYDRKRTFDVRILTRTVCEKEFTELQEEEDDDEEAEEKETEDEETQEQEKDEKEEDEVGESIVQAGRPYFVTFSKKWRRTNLHVPSEVLYDFNLKLRNRVTMRDPKGKDWPGELLEWSDGRMWIRGWKAFCKWNRVKKNDRCICELIEEQDRTVKCIKVHIERAPETES